MDHAVIASTGKYLPEFVLKNEDMVQFSEEARRLIGEKTGVYERRFAAEGQCTSDLAIKAALDCLEKAGCPAFGSRGHNPGYFLPGQDPAGDGDQGPGLDRGVQGFRVRHQFGLFRRDFRDCHC